MDSTINIITVCDNHFSVLLAALLKSIEINHTTKESIDIYIVSDKLSFTNRMNLGKVISNKNIRIVWLEMKNVIPEKWSLPVDNTDFPLNVYVRLFIPYIIPINIEKVIYLDVDMIVLKDISSLWFTDMNDFTIAGVVDRCEVVSSKSGIPNFLELGINPNTKYFNSGLQIINTIRWREENNTEQLIKICEVNKAFIQYADQYCLNILFSNKWLELDRRWNWYASNSDLTDPYIVHFVGNKPIYSSYVYSSRYKELFYHYLSGTPWNNYKPKSKIQRKLKKLSNKLKKKLVLLLNRLFTK